MIEDAIFTRLSTWPGLAALVADNIYPMRAPQNVPPPFVTYQRIGGPRLRSLAGASRQANPRIQVDVYGGTYAQAKAVAEQVRLALDNFRGSVGGIAIHSCSLESDRDLIDPDVDPPLYRVSHDFLLWHDE